MSTVVQECFYSQIEESSKVTFEFQVVYGGRLDVDARILKVGECSESTYLLVNLGTPWLVKCTFRALMLCWFLCLATEWSTAWNSFAALNTQLNDQNSQEEIYNAEKSETGSHTFTAHSTGEYGFCFSNRMSTVAHKTIYLDVVIGNDDPLIQYCVWCFYDCCVPLWIRRTNESRLLYADVLFRLMCVYFNTRLPLNFLAVGMPKNIIKRLRKWKRRW